MTWRSPHARRGLLPPPSAPPSQASPLQGANNNLNYKTCGSLQLNETRQLRASAAWPQLCPLWPPVPSCQNPFESTKKGPALLSESSLMSTAPDNYDRLDQERVADEGSNPMFQICEHFLQKTPCMSQRPNNSTRSSSCAQA